MSERPYELSDGASSVTITSVVGTARAAETLPESETAAGGRRTEEE